MQNNKEELINKPTFENSSETNPRIRSENSPRLIQDIPSFGTTAEIKIENTDPIKINQTESSESKLSKENTSKNNNNKQTPQFDTLAFVCNIASEMDNVQKEARKIFDKENNTSPQEENQNPQDNMGQDIEKGFKVMGLLLNSIFKSVEKTAKPTNQNTQNHDGNQNENDDSDENNAGQQCNFF